MAQIAATAGLVDRFTTTLVSMLMMDFVMTIPSGARSMVLIIRFSRLSRLDLLSLVDYSSHLVA